MDTINSNITGIVLAGGQSRRIGFNKAEAEVSGETMLNRMIEKLKELCPTILVSTGSMNYQGISCTQIPDEFPQCGPLCGIYSVLKASASNLNLIVSCDIPLVSVSLLKYIVSKAKESGAMITLPVDSTGQQQLLCAVYNKNILPVLKQQIDANQLKMKSILDLVPIEYINISKEHPLYNEYAFTNVNTMSSLQQVRELWHSKQG